MSPEVSVLVTGNKTLTAADAGIVQKVAGDYTITLPSTALGPVFIIENAGAAISGAPAGATKGNKSAVVTVAPAAADGITGNGFTAAVNKAAINTKATAKVGDRIILNGTGTAGVTGWIVSRVSGVWERQA